MLAGASAQDGGQTMRCYFDVHAGPQIDVDAEGIEVSDLDSAIAQACSAVAELRKEIDLRANLGAGAFVAVRVRTECQVCEISLDERSTLVLAPYRARPPDEG